jgi:hypothetical protein
MANEKLSELVVKRSASTIDFLSGITRLRHVSDTSHNKFIDDNQDSPVLVPEKFNPVHTNAPLQIHAGN